MCFAIKFGVSVCHDVCEARSSMARKSFSGETRCGAHAAKQEFKVCVLFLAKLQVSKRKDWRRRNNFSLGLLWGEEGFPSTPCTLFRTDVVREPHPQQPPLASIEPELQVSKRNDWRRRNNFSLGILSGEEGFPSTP